MRHLSAFAFFLLSACIAGAQKNVSYFVSYTYTNESIKFPDNQLFTIPYYMFANADSSRLFFRRIKKAKSAAQTVPGGRIHIGNLDIMPDTVFYKEGRWIKLTRDKWEPIKPFAMGFTETGQTRKILGYECTQFVATDSTGNQLVRIYASKALPPNLIPYIGLESFPYGILEIRHLGMGWKLIPRRVKKMK